MVALAKSQADRLRNPLAAASSLRKRDASPFASSEAERAKRHEAWKQEKRDLSGRANGTIDPWYGCFLGSEISDYATNFSKPWSECFPPPGSSLLRLISFYSGNLGLIPQTEPFWVRL